MNFLKLQKTREKASPIAGRVIVGKMIDLCNIRVIIRQRSWFNIEKRNNLILHNSYLIVTQSSFGNGCQHGGH